MIPASVVGPRRAIAFPRWRLALLAVFTVFTIAPCRAQIDPLPIDLAAQYPTPLRWHNVARIPGLWLAGRAPEGESFRLAPGERTWIRLPADSSARLSAPTWDSAGITVAVGDGSGLYHQQRWLSAGDDQLLQPAVAGDPELLLERPAEAAGALEFTLYAGRREPPPPIAPYRRVLPFADPPRSLRPARDAAGQDYWRSAAGEQRRLDLIGPLRVRIEIRLHYDAHDRHDAQLLTAEIDLDGAPLARPTWPTAAEARQPVFADGEPVVVSRLQAFVVEVPAGAHQLQIRLPNAAFVRLLALDDPDYLLPAANQPALTASRARAAHPLTDDQAPWQESVASVAPSFAAAPAERPDQIAAAAVRVAADERWRDGGLLAADALRRLAIDFPDSPEARQAAADVSGHFTSLQALQPSRWPAAAPRRYWLLSTRRAPWADSERGVTVASQHAAGWAARLESGHFLPLPDSRSALTYWLPEHAAHSRLWLTAAGEAATLRLQFDDEPPQTIYLAPAALAADDAAATALEAWLLAQRQRYGEDGVRSGAFARQQPPALVVQAATLELDLPATTRRIRVWREDGSPVSVALALRRARPLAWDDTSWQAAVRDSRHAERAAAWRKALAPAPELPGEPGKALLDARWQALARTLRADAALFAAGLAPVPVSLADDSSRVDAARRLLAAGQPLAALEQLAGQHGSQARRLQFETLAALGETYLSEQLCKALVLGDDTALASDCRERLAARYRSEGDSGGLRRLYATALLRDPDDPALATALANAYLDDGDAPLAVQLLLTLDQPPAENLAAAALAAGWLATLADAAEPLTPERRAYWLGWLALVNGDAVAADEQWRQAGDEGVALIAQREKRAAIAAQLDEGTPEALAAWAQARAEQPGPRYWAPAPAAVVAAAGAVQLSSVDRDQPLIRLLAEPTRPVRLRVFGPQRLRFELRPVHHRAESVLDGWIDLRAAGHRWVEPILNNQPAPGLAWVGEPQWFAGRAIVREISLPAGAHDLTVDAGSLPLLVGIDSSQALHDLGLLPPLDRDSLAAPVAGPPADRVSTAWAGICARCVSVVDEGHSPALAHFRVRAGERQWASAVAGVEPAAGDAADAAAAALASGDWPALLQPPEVYDATTVRRRLGELLWLAEQQPQQYAEALALAESLANAVRDVQDRGALLERLHRRAEWQPLALLAADAGERSRLLDRWQPESPALRARQALLAPLGRDEYRLPGDGPLVVTFDNPRPSRTTMVLTAEETTFQLPQAMTVTWQVDGQAARRVVLDGQHRQQRVVFTLPAGRHVLRLATVEPLADQWLRVGFGEGARPFAEPVERFYHLATATQAITADIAGPTWLRIDEWRSDPPGSRSESRYQYLAAGWQRLSLTPRTGESEALFRLHVLAVAGQTRPPPRVRAPDYTPQPPPPVPAVLPPPAAANSAWLRDDLPRPGEGSGAGTGQEPGTLSLSVAYVRRLAPEQDAPSIDRFWETALTWRQHDEAARRYFFAEALLRQRPAGDASIGLRAAGSHTLQPVPLNVDWQASLFAQRTSLTAGKEQTGWGGEVSAGVSQVRELTPKIYHVPRLFAFLRHAENPGTDPNQPVDADVFSHYRWQHRNGWGASDTWYARPWLDSVAYGGLSVVSNPLGAGGLDHLGGRLGWQQLVGATLLEVNYGQTHYLHDADRRRAYDRRRVGAEISHEWWTAGELRHQLALAYVRDLTWNEWGLLLVWTGYGGNGRAFDDFRSSEIPFADLRRRSRPATAANAVDFRR